MATVDNRVVSMKFDNAAFEKRISDTIRSLDKLSNTIAATGDRNGLDKISQSAKNFKMEGVSNAVEGVSKKFLLLSTVAITAISKITSSAISAGTRIVKSLSLDPVMDGFREYETNMNSIQTILANTSSKGSTLEDVNSALDTLNTYADQTIYNFSEMTRNIGTFTAAGIDLDTSTNAIKGIANVAAISGSNSNQASSAMYQLSQALASGTLKLMDWNSVVNAGMGGEVFQKALFETGKAMGTLADVPMEQTFDQWKDAGNTFRDSLESGWITGEVLTNTLEGFTGDLTRAQVLSMGYTEAQADEILRMGQVGKAAATEVKTLTQLVDTVKEAIGSGWSTSFRLILGDFEEAKSLFTDISEAIGDVVGNSADARNDLLAGWNQAGGRTIMIRALTNGIKALMLVIDPIKKAFRDVFPKKTSADLIQMTLAFNRFTAKLKPGYKTVAKIRTIFRGLFDALKIGQTIFSEAAKMVRRLFNVLRGDFGGSQVLDFFVDMGKKLSELRTKLVEGGGIATFFENLTSKVIVAGRRVSQAWEKFKAFFDKAGKAGPKLDAAAGILDRLKMRFQQLKTAVQNSLKGLERLNGVFGDFKAPDFGKFLDDVKSELSKFWGAVKDLFSGTDTDEALDIINTGLLAGLVGAFRTFAKNGFSFLPNGLFGDTTGLFKGVTKSFNELTGVLKAMQSNIKADTLLKIGLALAVLTASLVVLSLIDSEALTKALVATAVGFGQLVATLALLERATSQFGAAKLVSLSIALIVIAGSILILAFAMKLLSTMSWEDLAKGGVAITGLMLALYLFTNNIGGIFKGLVKAGIAIGLIAISMLILGAAMKVFATMSWEEIGKGLASVTGLLVALAVSMNAMSGSFKSFVKMGIAILLIAVAMTILAGAMKIFATMSWEEIGKGLAGMAGSLLAIALALQLMPKGPSLLLQAAAIVAVAASMLLIAQAMQTFGSMSWEEIGRGLVALAGALIVLAVAAYAMNGAGLGALAISAMALSLGSLITVLVAASKISFGTLVKGLAVVSIALAVLAGVAYLLTPAILPMLGLALALAAIGVAALAFGVGASLAASAFVLIAQAGQSALTLLLAIIDAFIERLPALVTAIALAVVAFVQVLIDALPEIIAGFGEIIGALLELIVEYVPQIVAAVVLIVKELLLAIRELFPDIVATGFAMLMALLSGIRDNIGEIVTTVVDIITNFLDALALKVPELIDSVYNLVLAIIEGVIAKLVDIGQLLLPKGLELLGGLWQGILDKAPELWGWFTSLGDTIGEKIGDVTSWLLQKGLDFLSGLLGGIVNGAVAVFQWFLDLPGVVIEKIGDVVGWLVQKGTDFLTGLMTGVTNGAVAVFSWFNNLPSTVRSKIGYILRTLWQKGKDLLQGLWDGAKEKFESLIGWVIGRPAAILSALGDVGSKLLEAGRLIMQGLWDGLKEKWNDVTSWLGKLNPANWKGPPKRDKVMLLDAGRLIMQGLRTGMEEEWDKTTVFLSKLDPADHFEANADEMAKNLTGALTKAVEAMQDMDEMQPTITPVIDLRKVQEDLKAVSGFLPEVSVNTARGISLATSTSDTDSDLSGSTGGGDLVFNQTINSPKALSTADIYRGTRSQIAIAKEKLSIA